VKKDFGSVIFIFSLIVVLVFAIILIIQIFKIIFGGSWRIEDVILALVVFNLTICFGIGGYLINLNNKILNVNTKLQGHLSWHRGKE